MGSLLCILTTINQATTARGMIRKYFCDMRQPLEKVSGNRHACFYLDGEKIAPVNKQQVNLIAFALPIKAKIASLTFVKSVFEEPRSMRSTATGRTHGECVRCCGSFRVR